jgi:hypothetical protein
MAKKGGKKRWGRSIQKKGETGLMFAKYTKPPKRKR